MYADKLEAEARSVKSRLGGGSAPGGGVLSSVRGKVSFKRSGGAFGGRGKSRSDTDEKWKHDLFEEVETILGSQGNGSGDLRSLLASKQQGKMGTRLSSRLGPVGVAVAGNAQATGLVLRSQLGGAAAVQRRGGGKPLVRRKGGAGQSAAVQAQKHLTVTLRNGRDGEGALEEEAEEEREREERPAVVRGGRGSLIVTTQALEEEDMDMDEMPGQVPIQEGRQSKPSRSAKQSVSGFLTSLGLTKYIPTFDEEEIDMPALQQMREEDLKELGIPMGPRKKILQAALGT